MTIENARKAGMLSDKLKNIDNMMFKAGRAMGDLANCGASVTIVIGGENLYNIPKGIAIEVINLIANRLSEEHDKIEAEIKAM